MGKVSARWTVRTKLSEAQVQQCFDDGFCRRPKGLKGLFAGKMFVWQPSALHTDGQQFHAVECVDTTITQGRIPIGWKVALDTSSDERGTTGVYWLAVTATHLGMVPNGSKMLPFFRAVFANIQALDPTARLERQ